MRKLALNLISLSFLGFFSSVNAQKLGYSFFVGGNYNLISQKSDYEIMNKKDVKPALSYSLGGNVSTNYKSINFLGSIEYSRISNRFNQTFRDPEANYVKDSQSSINNHYIVISSVGTIKIGKGLYIGAGLSGNLLLWSFLKVDGGLYKYKFDGNSFVKGDYIGKVFTNHNYKRILFSIPVIIGYDINRVNLFTRFNIGLMNRVKGDSFVREFKNTLIFGIGYRLNKYE